MFGPRGIPMRPIVHPTKCKVKHHCCEYIVPEIHPTHIQNVTHHNYKHVHSFPVTQSQVDTVSHQHFTAPSAVSPFGPGPGAPSAVSPFGPGPGMMGPGMGPGTVAGAGFGPGKCCKPRRPWF
ncbi:spore coat protein [Anaerobacillus sp. MEB173]|uniref:spore coat protein n=1 Tax=Anaerobacillus sp. MEB173 TaxID=3383345 RepID=UPI003F8FDBA9